MDQIIGNMASLGLLVLLFTAIARRAPDDRLRCWIAGWLCILIQIGLKLWKPLGPLGRLADASAIIGALAMAAIFFIVSATIVRDGRRAGLRLGLTLTLLTMPCLIVAIALPHAVWLLAIVVIVRQVLAVASAMRPRNNRRPVLLVVGAACVVSLAWMLYGITHGRSDFIILALLCEMYFVAVVSFWSTGWERSLGLLVTCVGLGVFAAIFPGAPMFQKVWPGASTLSEIAGVSMFCVAIGMILIVLEEDARSARRLSEEYHLTFDTNPHPLWIYDRETLEFLAVNHAACAVHGYTREEFARLRLPDIVEKSEMPQILKQAALSAPNSNQASRHLRKDGTEIPMAVTAHSIAFRGRPARFVLGIDVSEKAELQRQVLHHSHHDSLTGLPNRALFEEQFGDTVARAAGAKEKLAILCLDVDRFKSVNDNYSTAVGDECLKRLAAILRDNAGPVDLVARLGGDRFALVLTGLSSAVPAEHAISRLMDAFREPVVVGDIKIRLAVRAGLALCPEDGAAVATLWRSAESALSRAREPGGGQVVWSSSELRVATEQQLELEAFMCVQLEIRGFYLAYQPLYAMDGRIEALEALLRLNHPLHGPISPARFIPLAEETGLIIPIGEWVIEETCRQLSAWRQAGIPTVPIAVNVSGRQLMQSDFAERMIATMSRFGIGPGQIDLEVTESTSILNVAEVMRQMTMLIEIGIRFSMDDFGTGHSSLDRLDKLPLRVLKVDQAFTERLCAVDGTRSIVQAMIWMGKALNMRVVAEGVEREDQLFALREMGCDCLQGFLLSRPVPPDEIPRLLNRPHPLLTGIREIHPQPAT